MLLRYAVRLDLVVCVQKQGTTIMSVVLQRHASSSCCSRRSSSPSKSGSYSKQLPRFSRPTNHLQMFNYPQMFNYYLQMSNHLQMFNCLQMLNCLQMFNCPVPPIAPPPYLIRDTPVPLFPSRQHGRGEEACRQHVLCCCAMLCVWIW